MRVAILASGSRGDVQPFCALACALRQRGHDVVVATEERLQALVESFGLRYHRVTGDPTEVLHTPEGIKLVAEARFMTLMRIQGESAAKWWTPAAADYAAACAGVDAVVASPLCFTQGLCCAEKNRAKFVPMILGPSLRTRDFAVMGLGKFGPLNGFTYDMVFRMLWMQEKSKVNTFRHDVLNLPPLRKGFAYQLEFLDLPVILACSSHFFPNGKVPDDYPARANVVGFPFVPRVDESKIDRKLVDFLSASADSRPVVYIGFGSMPAPEPQKLYDIAAEACRTAGCRAVLVAGWSNIKPAADDQDGKNIMVVKECPHDFLLPRVRAIVHHCGVGTCGAALRSGVPQVPCPVLLDQPWNASTLHGLGVATKPLPFHKMTASDLAARLRDALSNEALKEKAKTVAALVERDGDAMAKACEIVERTPVPDYTKTTGGGSCVVS